MIRNRSTKHVGVKNMSNSKSKFVFVSEKIAIDAKDQGRDDSKVNRPVSFIALNGEVLNHHWWGRCVYDMSGLTDPVRQLGIDYNHDDNQSLGYIDEVVVESNQLICRGFIINNTERSREVVEKSMYGQEFGASVTIQSFDRTEELEAGSTTEVNGISVAGPLTIFREYSIRGVAITPYPTDAATVVSIFKNEKNQGEPAMTEKKTLTVDDFRQYKKVFGEVRGAKYFEMEKPLEEAKDSAIDELVEDVTSLEEQLKSALARIAELEALLGDNANDDAKEDANEEDFSQLRKKIDAIAKHFESSGGPLREVSESGSAKEKSEFVAIGSRYTPDQSLVDFYNKSFEDASRK